MNTEEKISDLEMKYERLSENLFTLTQSIHRLGSIALICFLLGLITGFLL